MKSSLLWTALVLSLGAVHADAADSRWDPWLGCWELVDDDRREPLVGEADPTEGQDVPVRGLVCLSGQPDGVAVTSLANGEPFVEEILIADGQRHPSSKGTCQGWQENRWSADGHRLFTTAELECEDDQRLQISGLSMMVPRTTWVDIQVVESPSGRAVVVRKYRPAHGPEVDDLDEFGEPAAQLSTRRFLGFGDITDPLSADDVAEAAKLAAPEIVEAAVLEHEEGFELDAETLIGLADAGVRPGLIDLMVALSYPDQFRVQRADSPGAGSWMPGFGPSGMRTIYGLSYPYYMVPFGGYSWYGGYTPLRYVAFSTSARPLDRGLVSQQGYVQVSPRTTVQRRARYKSGTGSTGSYSAGSGGSSSGSGTVSPSGYSRGGSSGRRAKPKKNN